MKTPTLHSFVVIAALTTASFSAPYTIQSGDNLYQIARRNGISVQALQKANPKVNPQALRAGQIIAIPNAAKASIVKNAAPAKAKIAKTTNVTGNYTIASGDTLSNIASRNGTSIASLQAANPNLDPKKMQVGQKIKLTGNRSISPQIAKAPATEPTKQKLVQESKPKPVAKSDTSTALAKEETYKNSFNEKPSLSESAKSQTISTSNANTDVMAFTHNSSVSNLNTQKESSPLANTAPTQGAGIGDVTPLNNTAVAASSKAVTYRLIKTSREQTLSDVAKDNNTTTDKLNALNGWTFPPDTLLAVDSELYVPAQP